MKSKIKVKINDDGITAKEYNPHGEEPLGHDYKYGISDECWVKNYNAWQEAEKNLRTFEIQCETKYFDDLPLIGGGYKTITYYNMRGQIVDAEILLNGKIKIL